MKNYARLQESGNIRAFLALMLTFGKGATLLRLANDGEQSWSLEQSAWLRVMAHLYSCCVFVVVVVVVVVIAYP